MKHGQYFILSLILFTGALLRLPLIYQGFFAFTYDQGRDLLAVRQIVIDHNFTLIGPTTGLPGIFYGPWWYYFLAPFFLISNGDPTHITLVFTVIGIFTVFLIYFFIKKITDNTPVALASAAIASMSQPFLTASSQIWSPSLVLPLTLIYVYALYQLFKKPSFLYFLILGLSSGFIIDSGAAFGVTLTLSTLIAILIFKKSLFKKSFAFYFFGLILTLLPRIIFDLRHDFLISKSIIAWLSNPPIYQEQLTFVQRIISRIDLLFQNFAQTFTQSNKLVALLLLIFIITMSIPVRTKLIKDRFFKFLLLVTFLIYTSFTIYPDAVWDYYLAGLPIIFIVIFALCASYFFAKSKISAIIILLLAVAFNFHPKLMSPFSITWQGDGAIFRNQQNVIEKIKPKLKGDYTLYVYTPARFDYPFDYLVKWYIDKNQIDPPKENQKRIYLIIRDDQTHSYLTSGWYGDKVKENTQSIKKEKFTGDIIFEELFQNDL